MGTSSKLVHAKLGASNASRWIACPGSVALISRMPGGESSESLYAQEGNAAHSLAERALRLSLSGKEWRPGHLDKHISPVGEMSNSPQVGFFPITEEMADAVECYETEVTDHLRRLPGAAVQLETRVYPLADREDMFGTADAVIVQPFGELVVIDFKYGKGIVVEPDWNDQTMYYGLGTLNAVGDDAAVSKIISVIVQPRAVHPAGPIRRWEVSPAQIRTFEDQLRSAARAAESPGAALIPGSHCRFCAAASICPVLSKVSLASALEDFEAATPQLRLPDLSDPAGLRRAMQLRELVSLWCDEIPKLIRSALERGLATPEQVGYKIVEGRTLRRWRDEEELLEALAQDGISPELSHELPKIKSPAQLEKLMGRPWVAQHTMQPPGPPTLAPITDRRPAIETSGAAAFPTDEYSEI